MELTHSNIGTYDSVETLAGLGNHLDMEPDHLGGRTKKRKKAKRAARKLGKKQGLKGKELRRFARMGAQQERARQLTARGKYKKAKKWQNRRGRTTIGKVAKKLKTPLIIGVSAAAAYFGVKGASKLLKKLKSKRASKEVRKQEMANFPTDEITSKGMGLFKNRRKDKKGGRGQVVRELIEQGATSKVKELLVLAPLRPLKGIMKRALAENGTPASGSLKNVANAFYSDIVVSSSSYQPDVNINHYTADFADAAMNSVKEGILNYVAEVKGKASRGESLTKVEQIIAGGIFGVEEKVEEQARNRAAQELGNKLLFEPQTLMIIGGVLLVLLVITFSAGRGTPKL